MAGVGGGGGESLDLPKNGCKGDLKIKKIIHVKLDFTATWNLAADWKRPSEETVDSIVPERHETIIRETCL